jgi:hypothetical protein
MESENTTTNFENQISQYRRMQQEKHNKETKVVQFTEPVLSPLRPLNPCVEKKESISNNETESEIAAVLEQISVYENMIKSYQRRLKTDDSELHTVIRSEIQDYEEKIINLRKRLRLLLF